MNFIIKSPTFWMSLLLSLCLLIATGVVIALMLIPTPPNYHRTKHFEFSLPDNWYCEESGRETLCNSTAKEPHNAIIIFAVKYRNTEDNLQTYKTYLASDKEYQTPNGEIIHSDVISVEEKQIGNYFWIDGLHFESEVPGYYTRYLATNTAQLGIVVTFSYHQNAPKSVIDAFSASILELKIYQNPSSYR